MMVFIEKDKEVICMYVINYYFEYVFLIFFHERLVVTAGNEESSVQIEVGFYYYYLHHI
jgi:hypothetical protein